MRNKPAVALVYILGTYVLLQFLWWGYHIIELTQHSPFEKSLITKRVLMILGEGTVFLSLLIFGLWRIVRSIRKDAKLSEQQTNFMLSVTHELKTPIAANKLYLQTILKRDLSPEKLRELLNKSLAENNRLEGLVEQILMAARVEQGAVGVQKEKINFSLVLHELVSLVHERSDCRFQLEVQDDVFLITDRFLITTVINNLLDNAVKYSKTEVGSPRIVMFVEGNQIIFQVHSFGNVISSENQQLLFRKFARLEKEETRQTKGTGLGLFIAFQMAQLLNGQLSYHAKEDQQLSIFELTLPYEHN